MQIEVRYLRLISIHPWESLFRGPQTEYWLARNTGKNLEECNDVGQLIPNGRKAKLIGKKTKYMNEGMQELYYTIEIL